MRRGLPYYLHGPHAPAGSWTAGLLVLLVPWAVTAVVVVLVVYGGRRLNTRRLIAETEEHLRDRAGL